MLKFHPFSILTWDTRVEFVIYRVLRAVSNQDRVISALVQYTSWLCILITDILITAYCDPPNPCPIGYTTADGCIEDFENSSEFSRGFQSRQKCICDTEHMFDCPEENAHRGADDIAAVVSI